MNNKNKVGAGNPRRLPLAIDGHVEISSGMKCREEMSSDYPQGSLCPTESSVTFRQGLIEDRLRKSGIEDFDKFWNLPHTFVEPINRRRRGWSGVSLLKLPNGRGGVMRLYLKRQENQLRYSWRHPFGRLTYAYEVEALQVAARRQWPAVELAAFGFRNVNGLKQAWVLTSEIECPPLSFYEQTDPRWPDHDEVLRLAGAQLFDMHAAGWQHGALFPAHMFINFSAGSFSLIDFERARKKASAVDAAESDLTQLIRRCGWIPDSAINALLTSYHTRMPSLIDRLGKRFPDRTLKKDEIQA